MTSVNETFTEIPEENAVSDLIRPKSCYGARHTQVVMLFLVCSLGFGMTTIISVTIVAMTDSTVNPESTIPNYDWNNKGVILSAFFWGLSVSQIALGHLIKNRAKWFLAGAMFVNSLFGILTPFMAALGSSAVIICRIVQGLAAGFFSPCIHDILAKWIPVNERSRMGTFVYAGSSLGMVLSLSLTGWICGSHLGWPFAFYIYGIIGMLWIPMWVFLGKNSPADHRRMDEMERKYIEVSIRLQENCGNIAATPWKAIVTSLPVWAISIAAIAEIWGSAVLMINMPLYLNGVLKYDIQSNGLLTAGLHLSFWLSSFAFSAFTDFLITKEIASISVARKIANSIGMYVSGPTILTLAMINNFTTDTPTVCIVLYGIAYMVTSSTYSGFMVNHMDLSPNHAGVLMGITNGIACSFALSAPLLVQFIVLDETNSVQWAIVFYIVGAVYIFTNTFFVLFGSGEVQQWNHQNSCTPNDNS